MNNKMKNTDKKTPTDENATRVPASEAIEAISMSSDGESVLVTMARGWESVLPQTLDEDPVSLIIWDEDNIAATVAAFNAAVAEGTAVAPRAWLTNHGGEATTVHHITVPGLKTAILTHAATKAGCGEVVGNAMIATNSVPQYCDVCMHFCALGVDPFFKEYAVCPIGRNSCYEKYGCAPSAPRSPC